MEQDESPAVSRQVPIVPYLRLPESGGETAHLVGSHCRQCGETYLGTRAICLKCLGANSMEEVVLSRRGQVFTYTVIHQSAPWVKVPYVAAVVKLPEGPLVRSVITDDESSEEVVVGMPVEMTTEIVRRDAAGNDIVAYRFRKTSNGRSLVSQGGQRE
ncbi:MAG: Zn-ribbon domain-containing OB-fold protein [Dehalococcoidales bacterium]|nr:Zn-ribbon domain-containing OB-fold protein [Dehalococcoidales bacterium]